MLVRMLPEERKQLRMVALQHNTTVQALVEGALRDLIQRYAGR
ncbi:MAG TPA: ribbon-helix-helix domain-containing protein [Saliniramus sp.]|nr:ribbon-helix-helix domain-containing protein [Saliniramus sp.]